MISDQRIAALTVCTIVRLQPSDRHPGQATSLCIAICPHATSQETVVDSSSVPTPPRRLLYADSSSTDSSTSTHLLRPLTFTFSATYSPSLATTLMLDESAARRPHTLRSEVVEERKLVVPVFETLGAGAERRVQAVGLISIGYYSASA